MNNADSKVEISSSIEQEATVGGKVCREEEISSESVDSADDEGKQELREIIRIQSTDTIDDDTTNKISNDKTNHEQEDMGMLSDDGGIDVLPNRGRNENDRNGAKITERVGSRSLSNSPLLVDCVAVVEDVSRGGEAGEVNQKDVHANQADHREREILEIDRGSKDGTDQVDAESHHLGLSNANVAENEGASEVLLPLGGVERNQSQGDEQKESGVGSELNGASDREANEDGSQRIATVVEQFTKGRAGASTTRLLSVQSVQSLIEPKTDEVQSA